MDSVSELDILELIEPVYWDTTLWIHDLYREPERMAHACTELGLRPDPILILTTGHLRRAVLNRNFSVCAGSEWANLYDCSGAYAVAVDKSDMQLMACLALRRTLDRRPTCRILPIG